ncbi:class F sortase [Streptomyces sp. NPDC001406]|uniref:class F sortase n=1 Tax=Streptomyces sp. NPDC001406 TaxID=3364572 RepID=UPI0036891ABE
MACRRGRGRGAGHRRPGAAPAPPVRNRRARHTLWRLTTLLLWINALAGASVPACSGLTGAAPGRAVPPQPAAAPVRLVLAAVGLNAVVVPVGVGADGRLAVPDDGKAAGWWMDTAVPGSRQGSVVIVGHLDTRRGAAVFGSLSQAKVGDPVTVTTPSGTVGYQVRAVTVRRGAALPTQFITTIGPPRWC